MEAFQVTFIQPRKHGECHIWFYGYVVLRTTQAVRQQGSRNVERCSERVPRQLNSEQLRILKMQATWLAWYTNPANYQLDFVRVHDGVHLMLKRLVLATQASKASEQSPTM